MRTLQQRCATQDRSLRFSRVDVSFPRLLSSLSVVFQFCFRLLLSILVLVGRVWFVHGNVKCVDTHVEHLRVHHAHTHTPATVHQPGYRADRSTLAAKSSSVMVRSSGWCSVEPYCAAARSEPLGGCCRWSAARLACLRSSISLTERSRRRLSADAFVDGDSSSAWRSLEMARPASF